MSDDNDDGAGVDNRRLFVGVGGACATVCESIDLPGIDGAPVRRSNGMVRGLQAERNERLMRLEAKSGLWWGSPFRVVTPAQSRSILLGGRLWALVDRGRGRIDAIDRLATRFIDGSTTDRVH